MSSTPAPENSLEPSCQGLTFPSSALMGLGAEFANIYASHVESPVEFLITGFWTFFGAYISPYSDLGLSFRCQPRLYTVYLGESGFPRKSSSQGYVADFFKGLSEGAAEGNAALRVHAGFGSGEGLAQFLVGKGEGGGANLARIPVVLLLDELKLFADKCQQQTGSIGLSMVNSLYESNRFENSTVRKTINIPECYLSLLAASTRDTFAQMWTSEFLSIGFPNRLFLVPASSTKRVAIPWRPNLDQLASLQRRVKSCFEKVVERCQQGNAHIEIEPAAQTIWTEFYNSLERSVHTTRLDTLFFRLSQILALSSDQFVITKGIAHAAIEVVEYELMARKLYDPIDADGKVARVEEAIRRNLQRGRLTERQLKQHVNSRRVGEWVFKAALSNVLAAEDIVRVPGKPRRYELVPAEDSHEP